MSDEQSNADNRVLEDSALQAVAGGNEINVSPEIKNRMLRDALIASLRLDLSNQFDRELNGLIQKYRLALAIGSAEAEMLGHQLQRMLERFETRSASRYKALGGTNRPIP